MKSDKLVHDFYVIALLGIDDDDVCSKAHWLQTALEQQGGDERFGVYLLVDRETDEILEWADETFSQRKEYYVCILRETSKRSFVHTTPVYVSPQSRDRFSMPKRTPKTEPQIRYYETELERCAHSDRYNEMMELRRRQREGLNS